jgi:hypothetical protein
MEFTHGKSWSYMALVLGLTTLLLFYYGEPYSIGGVFIGFMSLVFMSAMYFNLHTMYEEVIISKEREDVEKRKELEKFK